MVPAGSGLSEFVMPADISRFFDIEAAVSKGEDSSSEYDTDDLGMDSYSNDEARLTG
jgi:hypothetical protein